MKAGSENATRGYTPFDLTRWCNAGTDLLTGQRKVPLGLQTYRGLPFQVGPQTGDGPCFVLFGAEGHNKPVRIPFGRSVRWMVFAHRLLESHISEGETVGRLIATYRFRYANGEWVDVPIREQFEISTATAEWGHLPLLSVPDQQDQLYPQDEGGPWGQTGFRQMEVAEGYPRWFVLWAWPNPHPEWELSVLRVAPEDRPFLVGALTSSSLPEDPFGREPLRPVKITLLDRDRAEQPFCLGLDVDRGVTTYAHPLPDQTSQAFLEAPFQGWGQPRNTASSPAYVEIAAQRSATVRLNQGQQEIASIRWNDVIEAGTLETNDVRLELLSSEKNWVHVTVLDEDTGRPVPCRIHFRSLAGVPFQPHGHHNHLLSDVEDGTWHIDIGGDIRLGDITYAYIDGACQGWLPRGQVLVDVARGYEYEPLREMITIRPGQRTLTLRLKRWVDMRAKRWFSGDTHVHFLSTQGALSEAQGEDLNVVSLLQSQWGHLFTNTEDFIGQPVATPDGRTIVHTSQENRQHILGHLSLLGLKRPVMPWSSDGPGEAELAGTLETTLSHWADECHAQGGTVIIPHLPLPNGEPAALIATGRADAVEMLQHGTYEHLEYYRYLNGGYQLPLVGGSDKMTADVPIGIYRTYVHIPSEEPFTYENWCKNLRLGRTFLSGGPILRFTVDGAMIGDTLSLRGNGGVVEVEAEAESILPIHTLQIVQEGRVVASTEERQSARRLHLEAKLRIERHTWLIARVAGPGYAHAIPHHDGWHRGVMAHTSPIYVAVGGEWWMHSDETVQYMLTLLHGGVEYIRQRSRQYAPGTVTHHHGEEDHLAYLERPFQEAIEALRKDSV